MKLSVLIPVFNEVETIASVVERVQAVPLDQEIVLVNDASSDGSFEVMEKLASPQVKVIHHDTNLGKGAAVCTGLEAATGEIIVIQDADFEYDPGDFLKLIDEKNDLIQIAGTFHQTLEVCTQAIFPVNHEVAWTDFNIPPL